ncbi:ABC transporter [Streptomyces sp. NPDC052236]|uniref:ABC transporter n=1 Tax=Streptomyces sp. NPDC052236 TaxID=3365686 RepID=UPI0037D0158D
MTTLTGSPANAPGHAPAAPTARGRGLRLSGATWLVWRQHRAAYCTLIAFTLLTIALIAYQRMGMLEYLDRYDWPHPKSEEWQLGFQPYTSEFNRTGLALAAVPVLLGVFVGAPLLAADLENGTAKLVTSQAITRVRWLAMKLGITALVVTVGTTALSLAFNWWWAPIKGKETSFPWHEALAFNNTGPVPVALSLLSLVGGVAIGMLLRRTLMAMVVTLGFTVTVQFVWASFLIDLGNSARVASEGLAWESLPALPPGAYEMDRSYVTGSGELLGWSTCAREPSDAAMAACQQKADLFGWSTEYLPISQMTGMQWSGAAILLGMTAAIAAFILLWGRKRLA